MIPAANTIGSSPSLDLSSVKLEAQRQLFKLLDKFEGTKTIVWDDKLIGPFEFVANTTLLRQHEVTRWFRLSDVKLAFTPTTEYTLYFLRKDFQIARSIADILQRSDRVSLAKTSLVFVPQRCTSIEKFLEHHKVELEKLNSIEQLPIELFVLDSDLLSMENEFVFRDIHLNEDHSSVHQIVESLVKLQEIFGQIPRITGQGKSAKLVFDLLLKRRKLQPKTNRSQAQIHQLILIDRQIDLVTPFLTQLTYEGLLDEVFGIQHGTITLPSEKFLKNEEKKAGDKQASEQQPERTNPNETRRFALRSSEELYARLRDCHINAVADVLKQSTKNLQGEYDECNSEGKTIHEMGKIVKRLQHLKVAKNSQSKHVTIAELVNEQTSQPEFILGLRIEHELLQEDRINRVIPDLEKKLERQANPMHVLRLICLQSIISNGLKPKISEFYKREMRENYGEDYLLFLLLLERAKILLSRERSHETGQFSQLKSKLYLINDNVDECNPNNMAYVYGGYSPISVVAAKALAQFSQGPQWRPQPSDSLRLLPEPTVNFTEPSQSNQLAGISSSSSVVPIQAGETGGSLTSGAVTAASLLLAASAGPNGLRVRRNSATSSQSSSEEPRCVLVFFIGGCTFAEISALRFLSQQEENNCDFLVGTTKIINGKSFLESMWPVFPPRPAAS